MKYKKALINDILKNLRLGLTINDTCEVTGISKETFFCWIKEKPDFSDSVMKAQADCKRRCIGFIQNAMISDWKASAWWLERKYSDEYQLKNKFELSGANGKPVKFVVEYVK